MFAFLELQFSMGFIETLTLGSLPISAISPEYCVLVNDIAHILASFANSGFTQEFPNVMLYYRQNQFWGYEGGAPPYLYCWSVKSVSKYATPLV